MKSYKTLPRRKRYDIEKLPTGRKEAVAYLMSFLDKHNMTIEEFSELPPEKTGVVTIGNLRNPDHEGETKERTLTRITDKIALIENRPAEEIFSELTRGFPVGKYQYKHHKKQNTALSEEAMKGELFTKFLNIKLIMGSEQEVSLKGNTTECFNYNENMTTGSFRHDLILDYSESKEVPLNYWVIDIYKDSSILNGFLKDFFYKIVVEGADETVKYSIVTDSEIFFNKFAEFTVPALNIPLSCILYKDGIFKETYMKTAIDPSNLEKLGLTQ